MSGREADLIHEGSDEVRAVENFWNGRPVIGLRTNFGLNREASAFEAHADYWKHSRIHGSVARLIADLAIRISTS